MIDGGMRMARLAWGFATGTFGELVQGQIGPDPFLITLPIPWGARAAYCHVPGQPLQVWPEHRVKALGAAKTLLESWGKSLEGVLIIYSTLPIGKGMASSSADIVAVCRALAAFFGREIPAGDIARVASAIEPTDGIMFPGVVAFNPLRGVLLERLGMAPPATIVGVLGFGGVNTVDRHESRQEYSVIHQQRLRQALGYVRQGVERRDVRLLGLAGRISAEVDYERGADASVADLICLGESEGAGVIIAHSGTVRGLLLPGSTPAGTVRRLRQKLWALDAGPVYRIPVLTAPLYTLSGRGDAIQEI